jgi:hypothetical protein
LRKEASRELEAERKALHLEGFVFRCYDCAECGTADIFVDVLPLEGEADEDFRARRDELESMIGRLDREGTDVVLVERHPGFSVVM